MLKKSMLYSATALLALISAPAFAQEPDATSEVVVTGQRNYLRPAVVTASKTEIPQRELPLSAAAVTRTLMDDQQVFRVSEALKNIAAYQTGYSYGPISDNFILRGFALGGHAGSAGYRDGVRMSSYNFTSAGLETIEVIKGPASALYGRAEPGGVINFVTKKPVFTQQAGYEVQAGSHDFKRATVDINTPVNDRVAMRVVLDHVDTDTFRDFVHQQQIYIQGGLTWKATDRTQVLFQIEARNLDTMDDIGIPVAGSEIADIPVSRYLGEPDAGFADRKDILGNITVEHTLSDDWTLTGKLFASKAKEEFIDISFDGADPVTGNLPRRFFADFNQTDVTFASVELAGKAYTGTVEHNLLFGADRHESKLAEKIWYTFVDPTAIGPINIYNPVYGLSRRPVLDPSMVDPYASDSNWNGIYVQDLMRLNDKWRIMAGLRHDRAESGNTYAAAFDEDATTGRLGVVYMPVPSVSLYATTSTGFGSANGRSSTGEPLEGERSKLLEAGVKYSPAGGRLIATFAVYDMVKENVLTADPSTPDPSDMMPVGEVQSRGFDVDVSGWVTRRYSVQASYAFNDLEVTKDNSGLQGLRLQNAPEHAFSLWNRYDFSKNWTAGLGVYAVSEREGDNFNTYQMPGYVRVDVMAQWRFEVNGKPLTVTFNINNLFDEAYYVAGSDFYLAAMPGETRTFRVGLRGSF